MRAFGSFDFSGPPCHSLVCRPLLTRTVITAFYMDPIQDHLGRVCAFLAPVGLTLRSMLRTALFVEIPGVLIAAWAPDLLLPNVGLAMRRLRQRGVPVIAVTDHSPVEADEFPDFTVRLKLAITEAGGELAGVYAALPDKPASWRKPRPGMLLAAARELEIDLPSSWLIGTDNADAYAAAQAGFAGVVLIEGVDPPKEDLGIVVATALDLCDAPRVMIPRQGGCWHDRAPA